MRTVDELIKLTPYRVNAQPAVLMSVSGQEIEGMCDTIRKVIWVLPGREYSYAHVHETVHAIVDSLYTTKVNNAEHEIIALSAQRLSDHVMIASELNYSMVKLCFRTSWRWWKRTGRNMYQYGNIRVSKTLVKDCLDWLVFNDYVPADSYFTDITYSTSYELVASLVGLGLPVPSSPSISWADVKVTIE